MKAVFNGTVLAESNATVEVEGNHYFPRESVKMELLTPTDQHTTCPWKGEASYFTINAGGKTLENGAWTYPEPKDAARQITNHLAFYGQVSVEE